MKSHSSSSVTEGKQNKIKTKRKWYRIHTKIPKLKRLAIPNVGKDAKELELLRPAVRNVK